MGSIGFGHGDPPRGSSAGMYCPLFQIPRGLGEMPGNDPDPARSTVTIGHVDGRTPVRLRPSHLRVS
ncbi:hypothetical protein NJ76_07315 [Rhodococcus sp. IITR03]|nr:hypothetical protein NJ76_07315 [Rhodococcus sp. IITR03]